MYVLSVWHWANIEDTKKKKKKGGNSLAVQGLGIKAHAAEGWDSIFGWETLRSHQLLDQ